MHRLGPLVAVFILSTCGARAERECLAENGYDEDETVVVVSQCPGFEGEVRFRVEASNHTTNSCGGYELVCDEPGGQISTEIADESGDDNISVNLARTMSCPPIGPPSGTLRVTVSPAKQTADTPLVRLDCAGNADEVTCQPTCTFHDGCGEWRYGRLTNPCEEADRACREAVSPDCLTLGTGVQ